MAVTQNTFTGDGSTVLFSFTFPYLNTTDIKVSLDDVDTSAYTLANATTIQFNTAPANGVAIRIYRVTDDAALAAEFFPGSAIRAQDLNDNYTQNLYVTQESNRDATSALTTANSAATAANTALSTANAASATATTADTNASAAVATANTASTNASTAVSTANTASSNATTAVNTANSAAADAATALSTANTALSTANTADTNASAAVTTANTADTNATAAVSTANTASSNASSAVSTANIAASDAFTAVSTANTAISTANAAVSAVANAILVDIVANVAAIPGSPANNDTVEVSDSTGIESFTPLSGVPAGYVGDSGLSVRIVYTTSGATWNWIQYFPNDPETRYGDAISTNTADITTIQGDVTTLQTDVGTLQTDLGTAQSDILGLDSAKLDATTAASTYAPLADPTFTGTVTIPAGASINGFLTTATAASTYQTQAGMSDYLPTSSVGYTVQPFNANTAVLNVGQTFSALQTFSLGASDSSGSFRVVPANSQASAYTPVSSDTGKYISISSGGVTVPASIFNSGAVFSIYNNSGSPQTITQGSGVTLRQAGTTNTGNRSLAAYGIATVLCVGSDVFVISGVGLS